MVGRAELGIDSMDKLPPNSLCVPHQMHSVIVHSECVLHLRLSIGLARFSIVT